MKRKRLHYNKRSRNVIWLKTKVNAKSYKTMRGYIRGVFKNEKNYNQLVDRLEKQTPGIFDSIGPLAGKKYDKNAVLDFVTAHAKETLSDMKKKSPKVTLEQALKKELNTRVFVDQEELVRTNIRTFLQKHKNKGFADELRRRLGTNKIDYSQIIYVPDCQVKLGVDGIVSSEKAYVFKGTNVALVMTGSGNAFSPYMYTLLNAEAVYY